MQVASVKIGDFRQITRYSSKKSTVASVVNLVLSQFYNTERQPLFAARFVARRAGSSATADACILQLLYRHMTDARTLRTDRSTWQTIRYYK